MKAIKIALLFASFGFLAACGDMSNNVNEDHSHYTDSSGVNPDDAGNPNATNATMRNTYDTDSTTNTSGPDNAAPKSTAQDSTVSTQPRR